MPDETRISYAEVCRAVAAVLAEEAGVDAAYSGTRRRAAALRSLAALVEQLEQWHGVAITEDFDPLLGGKVTRLIATGYALTDPKEGESNG